MTNTTHYNLSKPEGTDLYNHLTIDNPNMDKIDTAMYNNKTHTVGEAEELKTGGVHRLTRTNTDVPVFKFTATSDFVAGETFTVDGVQVTAYTTNSQPLTTNAYRIGASVLCILNGTVLTVLVSSSTSAIAEDSEKLGGQLPAYYGTAQAVAQAESTAQSANVVAQQAQTTANLKVDKSAFQFDESSATLTITIA